MEPQAARPLVVIEGRPAEAQGRLEVVLLGLRSVGWNVVLGWAAPMTGERVVCSGRIETADDARRALLAAIAGAGLVVQADADRETIDRLVDELRSLGPVRHELVEATSERVRLMH